ncbi:MAG TPA: insulinase family protein, partial [bacterium]|nr:insulinase family protein [bacterium]
DSPWARRPTKKSLSKIGVADVRGFLDRYMRTGNMIIAASGDFDRREFVSMIREMTEVAPAGEAALPEVEEVKLAFEPGEERVARPLTQSFIRMGHLGIRRHNPDAYALRLMSEIFGAGAFKSRLMEDIRTVRGMAYSVWGDITEGTDYGLFVISVNTKAEQAPDVMELIRCHVKRLAVDGDVTDEELDFARRSVLSGLIFNFDRPIKVALSRAHYHLYGYPPDYWRVFTEGITGVTRQGVKDVAGRYIHPDGLKAVVVGPKAKGKGKER